LGCGSREALPVAVGIVGVGQVFDGRGSPLQEHAGQPVGIIIAIGGGDVLVGGGKRYLHRGPAAPLVVGQGVGPGLGADLLGDVRQPSRRVEGVDDILFACNGHFRPPVVQIVGICDAG